MPMRRDREPRLTQGDHGSGGGFVRPDRRTYVLRRVLLVAVLLLLAFAVTRTCQSLAASDDSGSRDVVTKDENAPKEDSSNASSDPGEGGLADVAPKSPLDPPEESDEEDRDDEDRSGRDSPDESAEQEAEFATAGLPEKETADTESSGGEVADTETAVEVASESPVAVSTVPKRERLVKSVASSRNVTSNVSDIGLAPAGNATNDEPSSLEDPDATLADPPPATVGDPDTGLRSVARQRSSGTLDASTATNITESTPEPPVSTPEPPVQSTSPPVVQEPVPEPAPVQAALEPTAAQPVPEPTPAQPAAVQATPVSESVPEPDALPSAVEEPVPEQPPTVPAVGKRDRGAFVGVVGGQVRATAGTVKASVEPKGPTLQVGGKAGGKAGKGNRRINKQRNGTLTVPGAVAVTAAVPVAVAPVP